MANNDRVSELYKGEIFSVPAQEKCRARIHWLCEQVVGDHVLDVGCSQGITAILLGREGRRVVGIDVEQSALEYARAELLKEPPAVQRNVTFQFADGGQLSSADATFDTVLLGEVLEHLVEPKRILQEIHRVLKPTGRLVVTTPLGILKHPDHKRVFLVTDFLELLDPLFSTVDLDLHDKIIRYVGTSRSSPGSWLSSATQLSGLLRKIEHEFLDLDRQSDSWKERSDRFRDAFEKTKLAHREALAEAEAAKKLISPLAAELGPLREALREHELLVLENKRLSMQLEQHPQVPDATAPGVAEFDRSLDDAGETNPARISELETQLQDALQSLAVSRARVSRMQLAPASLRIVELERTVQELESALAQEREKEDGASEKVFEIQNLLDQSPAAPTADLPEIQRQLEEELQQWLAEYERDLAAHCSSMAELQRQLEDKDRDLAARTVAIADLQYQLEHKDQDLAARAEDIADLRFQLERKDQDLAARAQVTADLRQQLEDKDRDLAAHTASMADLRMQLEDKERDLVTHTASVVEMRQQVETLEKEHSLGMARLRQQLQIAQKSIDASTARGRELDQTLRDRDKALQAAEARGATLAVHLAEKTKALAADAARAAEVERKYANEQAARQNVNASLQRYTALATSLEQKLASEQTARRKVNESLEHHKSLSENRKKQLNDMIEEVNVLRRSGVFKYATLTSAVLRRLGYHKMKEILRPGRHAATDKSVRSGNSPLPARLPAPLPLLGVTPTASTPTSSSRSPETTLEPTTTAPPIMKPQALEPAVSQLSPTGTPARQPDKPAAGTVGLTNGTHAIQPAPAPAATATPLVQGPTTAKREAQSVSAPPSPTVSAFAWPPDLIVRPSDPRELRIAGIFDEFSRACFEPECDLITFGPDNWRSILEERKPHMLFVESAWNGNAGAWQYRIASYTHPNYVGLRDLRPLLDWCAEHQVPTLFWNKEDPVHFDRFKEAAALFDVILTTDSNCIERYRQLPGLKARCIDALPFAAQPKLHHPMGANAGRRDEPCFAGTYYRDRHPARREQLEMILDAARPFGLMIYDRMHGNTSNAVGFPERFVPHVRGGLPYEQLVEEYRLHKVFLNANSVVDSPTMFSRRVFELLACGTAVVSTESPGIRRLFGNLVPIVTSEEEAKETIRRLVTDDVYRQRLTSQAMRLVLGEHTYRNRLASAARFAGFNVDASRDSRITLIALVDNIDAAPLLPRVTAQTLSPCEIILGVTRAGDVQRNVEELRMRLGAEKVRVVTLLDEPDPIRFQRLASMATSPWVWPVDAQASYGPTFAEGLIVCQTFAQAQIIGKAAYAMDESGPVSNSDLQHRYVQHVHPAGAIVRREFAAAREWPAANDDGRSTMERWGSEGVRFYSADADDFRPAAVAVATARTS